MKAKLKKQHRDSLHWTEFFNKNRPAKLKRQFSDKRGIPSWVKRGPRAALLADLRNGVVGKDAAFNGPFGKVKVVYCDYTASGKPLQFIEDFIRDYVFPFYANTHTTTNVSGRQTTEFRKDAREMIRTCVNASEDDAVIFVGSGSTAAVHKLIHVMQLTGENITRTVVINGPYEHHSNILPWKECGAHCDRVGQTSHGLVDVVDLENKLKTYQKRGFRVVVAMSAASNVTGIVTDTDTVSAMAHKYGAVVFWDYAAGGPYLEIDMNPSTTNAYKDAVYLSPHKFVGGVGTPGLLVAKKHLFTNPVPHGCGGGTVAIVTKDRHQYVTSIEDREEGGTPAIVESIRAGLAFSIKRTLGEDTIEAMEGYYCNLAFKTWSSNPNLHILGSHTATRVPIFALMVYNPQTGRFLHHNFICSLLNDLYGIQARGGCACAGPYAIELIGLQEDEVDYLSMFLQKKKCCGSKTCTLDDHSKAMNIMKFGFSRLNLPYFFDEETVMYVLRAVNMVATYGWKLLPLYTYDTYSGDWHHRQQDDVKIHTLSDMRFGGLNIPMADSALMGKEKLMIIKQVEKNAVAILGRAEKIGKLPDTSSDPELHLDSIQRRKLWFALPGEVQEVLNMTSDVPNIPLSKSMMATIIHFQEKDDVTDAGSLSTPSSHNNHTAAQRIPAPNSGGKTAEYQRRNSGKYKQIKDDDIESDPGNLVDESINHVESSEETSSGSEEDSAFSMDEAPVPRREELVTSFLRHARLSSVSQGSEHDDLTTPYVRNGKRISKNIEGLDLTVFQTGFAPGLRSNLKTLKADSRGNVTSTDTPGLPIASTTALSRSLGDIRELEEQNEKRGRAKHKGRHGVCTIS